MRVSSSDDPPLFLHSAELEVPLGSHVLQLAAPMPIEFATAITSDPPPSSDGASQPFDNAAVHIGTPLTQDR